MDWVCVDSSGGEPILKIAELWRYPVKSMAGEGLQSATVTTNGIEGDRIIQVLNSRQRVVTSRTRPKLLLHQAILSSMGEVLVDNRPWQSQEVGRDVETAAGVGATLIASDHPSRFDILPLLVVSDGAVAAMDEDVRRFRPNILIEGVEGLSERKWVGGRLRAGNVLIGVQDPRERCIMTTFDPDTIEQDVEVLYRIQRDFEGVLGLNCWVVCGGTLSVGDVVTLEQ